DPSCMYRWISRYRDGGMEALKTGLIYYENAAISGSVAIFMVRNYLDNQKRVSSLKRWRVLCPIKLLYK
ncbi:MAG: hypothetical protein ACR2PX_18195, partial [Endozoicomonas sp.]|uniref:hypothetical protein n=1 Tax=Endozoicomonas sp. TaxID=1892382 RepID=UPI003D9B75AC